MSVAIQDALALIQKVLSNGSSGPLSPTVAKNFNLSTNLQPFNLEGGAKILYPPFSPIRNTTPRVPGKGTAARFKGVLGVNTLGASIFASEGLVANQVQTTTIDALFPYVSMGLFDSVTLEQTRQGEGQVDSLALATKNLLSAFMMAEERAIVFSVGNMQSIAQVKSQNTASGPVGQYGIGGSFTALGATTLPAPSVTLGTGGALPAGLTFTVAYSALSSTNVLSSSLGISLPCATVSSAVSTAGQSVTIVVPSLSSLIAAGALPPGLPLVGYNIYVKLSTDSTFRVYRVNGSLTPLVLTTFSPVGAAGVVLPVVDTTAGSPSGPNTLSGLATQIVAATGNGSSSVFPSPFYQNADGSPFALSVWDGGLKSMWDSAQADPDAAYLSSTESVSLTNLTVGTGTSAGYFVGVQDQQSATGSYRVSRMINKVTGKEIVVNVHPYFPQGTILFYSHRMPPWYVGADIPAVAEMDMVMDYTMLRYFPTQPSYPFEVRTIGTYKCYMPSQFGLVTNVAPGSQV